MFSTSFLLLTLLSTALTVPVQWESSSCAQRCNSDPQFIRYDSGKTYVYQLDSKTQITYGSSSQGLQTVAIKANVELSTHSPCEMSLQLRDVQLNGLGDNDLFDLKQQLESQPLQFGYSDGQVVGVCPSQEDESWVINVKKSVLSALQMTAKSTQTKSIVLETDILGNCETVYEPISRRYATIVIQKTKNLNSCSQRQETQIGLFPRQYGLNQLIRTSAPIVNSSFVCSQTIDKDMVIASTCEEQQLFWPSSIQVESGLNLRFEKQITGLSVRKVQQFSAQRHQLLMTSHNNNNNQRNHKEWDESQFISLLRSVCNQIRNDVVQPETTQSFPEIVSALEVVSTNSIQRVWNSVKSGELCDSPKLQDLVLDASALASSEGSVQLLVQSLQENLISKTRAAYLFSLMAFTSNPSNNAVQQLLPLLESSDTPPQVIVGISGLIHNLKQQQSGQQQPQPIRKAIDAIVARVENARQQPQIISLLRALENIGVEKHERARQVLLDFALNAKQRDGVRIVAIQALRESINDNIRQQLLDRIFRQQSEPNEVRIQAYKTVVLSGVSPQQLQQIKDQLKRESNENIVEYVRSHQKNLRETSDPHKKDILPENAPQFQSPRNEWTVSRNFELSYLYEPLEMGVAVEADLIFPKQSRYPRALTLNVSLPLFGRELQVFEIQFRQLGLDQLIGQIIRRSSGNLPKLFRELLDLFLDQNVINSNDILLQMNWRIDGKTVLFLDSKQIDFEWNQLLNQLRQQLEEKIQIDRAFAVIPVNTRIQFPTSNGFPMFLTLNTTVVSGLTASVQLNTNKWSSSVVSAVVVPSVAVQVEGAIQFQVKNQRKSLEFVSRLSSSPSIDISAQIREGRNVNVKVNLQKDKQSLVRFEAKVYERDESGQRKVIKGQQQQSHKQCTQTLNKPLGVAFCSELSYSFKSIVGPTNGEISLIKTDKSMKGFEFVLEMPPNNAQEMLLYRVSLNSPQSEFDRHLSAELQVMNPQNGKKEVKFQIRSPWKKFSASAAFRNEDKERAVQFEMINDDKRVVSVDAGMDSQTRGQKREYRPRVRITLPGSEPISLQGSVSMSKGRKNQYQINLEGNQKQFLKGSFVREGERKSNEFRVSSDVTMNLLGVELRVIGVGDKAQKHMMTDFTVEYKIQKQRKESFKLSAKLQNLTQSQLTKMSAFSELTSTQFPKFNFHLAYNLLRKPSEHVENELTVAWSQQLNSKIHLLQVSKYTAQDDNQQNIENTLVMEATPIGFNYELRANAQLNRRGSEGPKYNVELVGKDRTGRKDNDLKGTFQYRHISRSPLHLSMDAMLKTSGTEMSYRDELKEMSPHEYNGKTSVQWQKGKVAQLEYNYKVKSESDRTMHHEIDAELKTPHSQYPIRHTGLLRMTRNELHLKSKLNYEGQQAYAYESLLSRAGPSKVNIDVKGVQTKLNVSPYSLPQLASVEVSSDGYHHKSNVEFIPRNSFALKSDTKRNARNIFALESHISNSEPTRVVINSEPFEGRLDFDPIAERKTAAIEIRSPTQKWSHISQYNYDPSNRLVSLKSNTESNGNRLLNIDSQLARRQQSFLNLESPQSLVSVKGVLYGAQKSGNLEFKTNGFNHKSSVEWNPREVKLISNTLKNRQQLADLDYNYNNGLHSLSVDTPQYSGQLEGQIIGQPFGKFGLKSKQSQYEHLTRLTTEPQKFIIESKTEKRGQNLLNLNALLSRDSTESNVHIITPQIRTKLSGKPFSSAKFEWNSPQYSHVSSVESQQNQYVLDSKTQLNQNNRQNYNFLLRHSPQQSTLISAKIPYFESEIQLQRENPSFKIDFQGKHPRIPFNHVTELQANQRSYSLNSRTDRSSNGQNLLSLDGQYYPSSQSQPSQLSVNYLNNYEAKVKVNPFNPTQRTLNFETKSRDYNHVTDIQLDSNNQNLQLKSRTNRLGENVAKIDSFLTPNRGQRSHFSIVTQNSNANLEFEPQKRARIELRADPFVHESEILANNNGYKLQSLTTRRGQNVFNLNSALNSRDLASHLNIESPQLTTQLIVNPNQRNAKLELKTQSLNHFSKINNNGENFLIQSKTDLNNRVFAHLNTELNGRDNNQFDLEIPSFASKSNVNLISNKASIDFRSKLRNGRHVLASIALNPNSQNGFHCDISWDKEKDPEQRLVLDLSARREGSSSSLWSTEQFLVLGLDANYASNQLKVLSKMNSKQFINGPHDLTIDYIPRENPSKDSVSFKAQHVIQNNEIQCKWNYFEANQQKFGAQFNGKYNYNDNGVAVTFETFAPKYPELEYKASLNQRSNSNQWFAEFKASQGLSNQYKLTLDLDQPSHNQVRGVLSLETPKIQGQSVNILLEKSEKQFSLNAVNQNGKQLEFKSGFTENGVQFDLKSYVNQIPSIRANAHYVPNKEVAVEVVKDAQKVVDFSAKLVGNALRSGYSFESRFESIFTPNVEIKAKARKDSSKVETQINIKYNAREVFAAELNAQNSQNGWSGEGVISGNGAELARGSLESSFGSNSLQYLLKANGQQFSPVNMQFNVQSLKNNEKKSSLNLCSQQNCVQLMAQIKQHKYSSILPEKLSVSLKKEGTQVNVDFSFFEQLDVNDAYETSLLQLTTDKKIQQRIRNQLLVSINSHELGFDMINTKRDNNNAYDSLLKVHFPSNRIIQLRSDYKSEDKPQGGQKHVLKMDFKLDAKQSQSLFESNFEIENNNNQLSGKWELSSEKFRRNVPKVLSFVLQKPTRNQPFDAKIVIDVTQNQNNALTIQSQVENQDSYDVKNTTMTFSVVSRDRRHVNFNTKVHVSSKSAGILWQNVNRNGQKKQGFYFVKSLGNQRFEGIVRDSVNQFRIVGNFAKNENSGEFATDISIIDEQQDNERNVRFSLSKLCGKFESKKDGQQEKRMSLCLNPPNSGVFAISAESQESIESEKSVDLSLEIDTRSQKVMKVHAHWNPQKLQQILYNLAQNLNQGQQYQSSAQFYDNEFLHELSHKSVLITKQLTQEFFIPLIELFTDESGDLFQELAKNFRPIKEVIEKAQHFIPDFQQIYQQFIETLNRLNFQSLIPEYVSNAYRSLVRSARKQCKYSETCYQTVYAMENYGSRAVVQLLTNKALEMAKYTHRIAITTSGQLIRSLPSIDWKPYVPQIVRQYLEEYSDDLQNSLDTIINSNQDLKAFVQHLRQIFNELIKENIDSIDWSRVQQSANQIADLVFSRSSLSSSTRTLVWDPQRGEMQIEIRSPVLHSRRLRAVMQSVNTTIKHDSKVKQLFNNLEHKYQSFKSRFI